MGNSDQVEFSNKLALVYEAYNKLLGSDAKQLLEEIQKSEAWAICINDDIDSYLILCKILSIKLYIFLQ